MPKRLFIIFIPILLLCSFADTAKKKVIILKHENKDSLKIAYNKNIDFFANVLLKKRGFILRNYLRKYQLGCGVVAYKNSDLKEDFEGVRTIRSVYSNKKTDAIFVVPPFNHCDEGDSYCFCDQTLPRLYTESYCCHPKNLFTLPDIDEDGIKEIGIYYSSCSSRFKTLIIYSLKKGKWKEISSSMFDTFMKDPDKTRFDSLVKKISKSKFKICDFANGKTEWKVVTMK
jgi:hypothetical protein